jgi:hypothetical protein
MPSISIEVEVEDEIYAYQPADNGAMPLWCHGSTVVTRHGEDVFVAGLETIAEQKPLNNTRWVLFHRNGGGDWQLIHRDLTGRTREPSPIALSGSDLLVSANPTLTDEGTYNEPAQPVVFRFDATNPSADPQMEQPIWDESDSFSEHSYRTFAADADTSGVLYLQNEGYEIAHLSLRDTDGWHAQGQIRWPWGGEYAKPQPLRLCYPNVMLRRSSAHFLGVGDIVEPVDAWREAKKQITGREWDYVFRRLFYASSADISAQPFGSWLELANHDATAGSTRNCDLWVDATGDCHILWIDINTDLRIRDQFFPETRFRQSLQYAIVRQGNIVAQHTLSEWNEFFSETDLQPTLARIHITASGQPLVLAQFQDPARGQTHWRAAPLEPEPSWAEVSFDRPMGGTFLTNTVRAGSTSSDYIDIVGSTNSSAGGDALGYARLHVEM